MLDALIDTAKYRMHQSGRYLLDLNGNPFPVLCRNAWSIIGLSVAAYTSFLDDTVTKGFNAIEVWIPGHYPNSANVPSDGAGNLPFTTKLGGGSWPGQITGYANVNTDAPDFTTPTAAYWAGVDAFFEACRVRGIVVFVFFSYFGYDGTTEGWREEIVANGATKMGIYGAALAARYKNQVNLVKMIGGDRGTDGHTFSATELACEDAFVYGLTLSSGQASSLVSTEWVRDSIGTDLYPSVVNLNNIYIQSTQTNTQGARAYAVSPAKPVFLSEGPYEETGSGGNPAVPTNSDATEPLRRVNWWAWLATTNGYTWGQGYIFTFASGYLAHMNTTGTLDCQRQNAFVKSIPWWTLVPETTSGGAHTFITAGGGSSVTSTDWIAAAKSATGSLMVAYYPPAHSGSVTFNMTVMAGTTTARWFDPTTGTYSAIGSFPNTGTQAFTTTGNNSAGDADWILRLDA